jgi:hypothetical protein
MSAKRSLSFFGPIIHSMNYTTMFFSLWPAAEITHLYENRYNSTLASMEVYKKGSRSVAATFLARSASLAALRDLRTLLGNPPLWIIEYGCNLFSLIQGKYPRDKYVGVDIVADQRNKITRLGTRIYPHDVQFVLSDIYKFIEENLTPGNNVYSVCISALALSQSFNAFMQHQTALKNITFARRITLFTTFVQWMNDNNVNYWIGQLNVLDEDTYNEFLEDRYEEAGGQVVDMASNVENGENFWLVFENGYAEPFFLEQEISRILDASWFEYITYSETGESAAIMAAEGFYIDWDEYEAARATNIFRTYIFYRTSSLKLETYSNTADGKHLELYVRFNLLIKPEWTYWEVIRTKDTSVMLNSEGTVTHWRNSSATEDVASFIPTDKFSVYIKRAELEKLTLAGTAATVLQPNVQFLIGRMREIDKSIVYEVQFKLPIRYELRHVVFQNNYVTEAEPNKYKFSHTRLSGTQPKAGVYWHTVAKNATHYLHNWIVPFGAEHMVTSGVTFIVDVSIGGQRKAYELMVKTPMSYRNTGFQPTKDYVIWTRGSLIKGDENWAVTCKNLDNGDIIISNASPKGNSFKVFDEEYFETIITADQLPVTETYKSTVAVTATG